jgi:hypothetical protein
MMNLGFPPWMYQNPTMDRPPGIGRVFYVHNWTGSDNNNGIDPGTPFATIAHALTECVDDRNDYIIVLQHWQEDPIAIDKTLVHIIGISNNPALPFICLNNAANNDAIFTITAECNHVEIAGFMLGGGAGHAAIENLGGTPQQAYIHNCVFGHRFSGNTPQDGILIGVNATGIHIEDCIFFGLDAAHKVDGLITRDGIHIATGADPMNGVIRNNRFMGIPGVGINLSCTLENGGWIIEDNRFFIPIVDALAAGWAITLQSPVAGCMVNNNHAMQTGDGTGNNPYRDLSNPGLIAQLKNGWGMNYSGQAVIAPATV